MRRCVLLIMILTASSVVCQSYWVPKDAIPVGQTNMYPIGWSQDGKFAYISLYVVGGACGFCPFYEFVLASTVTDEVLARLSFDGYSDDAEEDFILPLSELWNEHFPVFTTYMTAHRIEQQEVLDRGDVPFSYRGALYHTDVSTDFITRTYQAFEAPRVERDDIVGYAEIRIFAEGRGSKIVHTYRDENASLVTGLDVAGYVMSPFEPRAALLVKRRFLGSEGEENELVLIGAHLTYGYE